MGPASLVFYNNNNNINNGLLPFHLNLFDTTFLSKPTTFSVHIIYIFLLYI